MVGANAALSMTKFRLWPCKDIDFSWSDVVFALWNCLYESKSHTDRKGLLDPAHDSVICMSVRSAFDLYLASRGLGRGDECLFVGVNVPDMFRIAETHGVRVVGVDIDPLTTEVDLSQLRERITQNTRCIVVPHLFGYRYCIDEVIELANTDDIDVIEDCAQAFAGTSWSGSERATLSLFSFGPMKTATALQGGIAIVRDSTLFESMSRVLGSYPAQPTWRYFIRILRFSAMKIATSPTIYGMVVQTMRLFRIDHEAVIHASTKSAKGSSFELWLRMRPCNALVRVIRHQAANSDDEIQQRILKGTYLTKSIGDSVPLVLRNGELNVFWMVPLLVCEQETFKNALRREGFDALSGRLRAVDNGETSGALALERAVMLPFSPCMSDAAIRRLSVLVVRYFDARN